MKDLVTFDFRGNEVRTVTVDGEPWFVANDVANVLGYKVAKDAVSAHCKGAVKHRLPTQGGIQQMTIIPERDLYRLVMRSRLPEAEAFEEWVVGEVLPSIRKTGSYTVDKPKVSQTALAELRRSFTCGLLSKQEARSALGLAPEPVEVPLSPKLARQVYAVASKAYKKQRMQDDDSRDQGELF